MRNTSACILARTSLVVLAVAAAALSQSVRQQKPPEVIPLESLQEEAKGTRELRQVMDRDLDSYGARLIEMSDWLYHNPESGHMEFKASELLSGELKKHGFSVEFGVTNLDRSFDRFVEERYQGGGLKTAFVAKYRGSETHPVICFMLEEDALRSEEGPFHGCQHNQQGPAAIGSAIALSRLMEKHRIPGSVWVVHCPAEEIPPATKAAMIQAGVFDQVDFLIRSHGTTAKAKRSRAGLGNCCMLIEGSLYTFRGKPAHGSRAWQGRDALDAARLFFDAVDMLREHSEPTFRFMGTITKVGKSPNVTNDFVEVDHWIRNSDRSGLQAIHQKVEQVNTIARGAAMAAFCDVDINHYSTDGNGIESGWLQVLAWRYTNEYGDAGAISEELEEPTGWDESGIGAVNVRGVQVRPAVGGVPEVAGHSYENAAITISPEGHKGLIQTAKIGSAVALRLLTEPGLRAKIEQEQLQWQRWGLENGLITTDMIRKRAGRPE